MKIPGFLKNMFSEEQKQLKWEKKQSAQFNQRELKYNDRLRDEAQKQRFLNSMNKIKPTTFTKKIVIFILVNSVIDVNIPFALAFMGLPYEGLVPIVIREVELILGVAFAYMIRAYFDSRAEHKNLDDDIKGELTTELNSKISSILSAAGINIQQEEDESEALEEGFHVNKHKTDSKG